MQWVVGEDGSDIVKGRMKFCRPVFQDASKVDKQMAIKSFKAHKSSFHPIAAKMIEKVSVLYYSVVYQVILAIKIRREHILEDTLAELDRIQIKETLNRFSVEFLKEPGVDQGTMNC